MPTARYPSTYRWRTFFFNLARLFFLSTVVFAGALFSGGCDRKQYNRQRSETPVGAETRQSELPGNSHTLPDYCPPAAGPDVFTPAEKTEHSVILSWKASASDPKHADAIGYCIYRSLQGKRQPLQRVNIHPFSKTACTDDLVENSKKYDYKVMAISKRRVMSRPSNVAHAEIPKDKPRKHTEEAPPLCRAAEGER
jgi:hypothetical protein